MDVSRCMSRTYVVCYVCLYVCMYVFMYVCMYVVSTAVCMYYTAEWKRVALHVVKASISSRTFLFICSLSMYNYIHNSILSYETPTHTYRMIARMLDYLYTHP